MFDQLINVSLYSRGNGVLLEGVIQKRSRLAITGLKIQRLYLPTEWVDYVEEPMKYQALRPHFFSVVGWGRWWRGGWWGGGRDGGMVVVGWVWLGGW